MKTSYEERGMKFAKVLAKMFEDCETLLDFKDAIYRYNLSHKRKLHFAYGVSRIAIIRSDYVIKFDVVPVGWFVDGHAGNCETEKEFYDFAVKEGMEYLLAKPSLGEFFGHTFSVMPFVRGVDDEKKEWCNTVNDYEYDWLKEYLNDLHRGNVGYRRGKVCIIDYAWSR